MRYFLVILLGFAAHAGMAEDVKKPVVQVATLEATDLYDEITYPARATSAVQAVMLADVDGTVTEVLAPLGFRVVAGQGIMRVKNNDPVYEYVPVTVKAQVSGIVSSLDVSVGSMVRKGQNLATVTDPTKLRFDVEIASEDLKHFTTGKVVGTCQPIAGEGAPLNLRLLGVSPQIDPATGTATAQFGVVGGAKAAVGSLCRAVFHVNSRKSMQVAEEALVYRGQDVFLRRVKGGKASFVKVGVVAVRRGQAEISGVAAGDIVITRASMFVADGQEVVVQQASVAKKS